MADHLHYWDYLRLDQLLALQGGFEDDDQRLMPDELHFIVVHQVFELWFKLVLREMRLARDHLAAPEVPEEHIPLVVYHLGRVNAILRLLVEQFSVMETLTPQDFLAFRTKLMPASGFQSFQMREIEILTGLEDAERESLGGVNPVNYIATSAGPDPGPAGALAVERIRAVRAEQTFRQALHDWLYRTPIQGSSPGQPEDGARIDGFVEEYLRAHHAEVDLQCARTTRVAQIESVDKVQARFQRTKLLAEEFLTAGDCAAKEQGRIRRIRAGLLFIESYRQLPLLAWPRLLIDTVVEMEEQMVLMRTRHARMVERIIGRRVGTGGSAGVDYLDQTTRYRVFKELWSVRTLLLPASKLPPLQNAGFYGFAH